MISTLHTSLHHFIHNVFNNIKWRSIVWLMALVVVRLKDLIWKFCNMLCSAPLYEMMAELKYLSHIYACDLVEMEFNVLRMSIICWMGLQMKIDPLHVQNIQTENVILFFCNVIMNDKDGVLALFCHEILVFRLGICAYNIVYVLLSTNNESPYSIPFSNVVQCKL